MSNIKIPTSSQTYVIPRKVLSTIAWPMAMLSSLRALYLGIQGDITNDYLPVYTALVRFRHHLPVYVEDLNSVAPHYLYPPSGSLLLSPLSFISYTHGRDFIIGTSVIAIIVSITLLFTSIGLNASHPLIPASVFIVMLTESVLHSLSFTNINGILFFAEIYFLTRYYSSNTYQSWSAGLLLGLTLAIKPIFIALIFLPLLYKKWGCLFFAICTPLIANLCAWPLAVDPQKFISVIIPYIKVSRSFYNSALPGIFQYYGISSWMTLFCRITILAIVLSSLYILYVKQKNNIINFSYTYTGISLAATFLLGSLGQGYYSLFLIPIFLTIVFPHGAGRNPYLWIGAFLCLNNGPWLSFLWMDFGRAIEYWRMPAGWVLMILGASAAIYSSAHFSIKSLHTAKYNKKLFNKISLHPHQT